MTLAYDAAGTRYRRSETGQPEALYFGEWVERVGGESRRLLHLPGLDQVVAEVSQAGTTRALLRDGTANVTHVAIEGEMESYLVFDQEGSVRRYEAFGRARTGGSEVERGFAGRPREGLFSGLVNLRARHYDPATGSFLQPDPLGIDASELYAYAASNPYAYVDPTGFRATQPGFLESGVPSLRDYARGLGFAASAVPTAIGNLLLEGLANDPVLRALGELDRQYGDELDALTFSAMNACGPAGAYCAVLPGVGRQTLRALSGIGKAVHGARGAVSGTARLIGVPEAPLNRAISRLRGLRVGDNALVGNIEAFGSRAGSTFRGRGPTPTSDLDLLITVSDPRHFVGGSRSQDWVRRVLAEIRSDFESAAGFPLEITPATQAGRNRFLKELGDQPLIPLD